MFERFTDHAREAMSLALSEAERLNHQGVGTEHILLGIVKVGGSKAQIVLKDFEVLPKHIITAVESFKWEPNFVKKHSWLFGWVASSNKLPQTPGAKKVVEYALEEARALNQNYVGTEHLLLGLLRAKQLIAAQILTNRGLDYWDVRRDIIATMENDKSG